MMQSYAFGVVGVGCVRKSSSNFPRCSIGETTTRLPKQRHITSRAPGAQTLYMGTCAENHHIFEVVDGVSLERYTLWPSLLHLTTNAIAPRTLP